MWVKNTAIVLLLEAILGLAVVLVAEMIRRNQMSTVLRNIWEPVFLKAQFVGFGAKKSMKQKTYDQFLTQLENLIVVNPKASKKLRKSLQEILIIPRRKMIRKAKLLSYDLREFSTEELYAEFLILLKNFGVDFSFSRQEKISRRRLFTDEFRVGDRVAIIRSEHGWFDGSVCGKITTIYPTYCLVEEDSNSRYFKYHSKPMTYEINHPRDIFLLERTKKK